MTIISKMFTPPVEEELGQGVALQVMSAALEADGRVFMTMRAWNGALLYAGRADGESDRSRRGFAAEVNKKLPELGLDVIAQAIMGIAVRVSDLLRAEMSSEAPRAGAQYDTAALWLKAQALAESPAVLHRHYEQAQALGLVGEEHNLKMLILAAVARLLDEPVSVIVKGVSSSGKSWLIGLALRLLSQTAYFDYTAVSPRYLAFCDHDLRHKIVVIYEAAGLEKDMGAYIMRSLLSEGRLHIGTVDKNNGGGIGAREIVKEGPTALFTSTTRVGIDDDLETRHLTLTVRDDEEQSRAILRGTARRYKEPGRTAQVDCAEFHALHEWLASAAPYRVAIPFADSLAELVPVNAVRIRRDFPKLLNLIAASAVLHKAQRDSSSGGAIIAALRDYVLVRELLAEAFTAAQHEGITPKQREAYEAVAAICADKATRQLADVSASLTEVRRQLNNLSKSATTRRLAVLVDGGYIQNLEPRRGQKARYCVAEALPDDTSALPTPEELAAALGEPEEFEP